MSNTIGRKILAGTAAVVATPFGVAGAAVGGAAGIVNNVVGSIFELRLISTPFVAVASSLETVGHTVSALALTPIAVYKAIDEEDPTKLHAIASNMNIVSESIISPYEELF